MARYEEIEYRREAQESVIADFRNYYSSVQNAQELPSESLISHHDPSIRFTNSTTSVMKPFLENPQTLDRVVYLAQPAMGQQGLFYWQRDHTFGPYASYFVSLGALYPPPQKNKSLTDMVAVAKTWGITEDQLTLAVHESDEDLLEMLDGTSLPIRILPNEDGFRHSYGLDNIIGRNLNIEMRDVDRMLRTLGNLTLIQTVEGEALGYEVSFDSTTATSLAHSLAHPVFAHYQIAENVNTGAARALTDTLSVTAALLIEGLTPASKGRSGILRKFMMEYIRLAKNLDETSDYEIVNMLNAAVNEESIFRQKVSPERRHVTSSQIAKEAINQWVDPLSRRVDGDTTTN